MRLDGVGPAACRLLKPIRPRTSPWAARLDRSRLTRPNRCGEGDNQTGSTEDVNVAGRPRRVGSGPKAPPLRRRLPYRLSLGRPTQSTVVGPNTTVALAALVLAPSSSALAAPVPRRPLAATTPRTGRRPSSLPITDYRWGPVRPARRGPGHAYSHERTHSTQHTNRSRTL